MFQKPTNLHVLHTKICSTHRASLQLGESQILSSSLCSVPKTDSVPWDGVGGRGGGKGGAPEAWLLQGSMKRTNADSSPHLNLLVTK